MADSFLPVAAFTRTLAFAILGLVLFLGYARWRRIEIPPERTRFIASILLIATLFYIAVVSAPRSQASFDRLAWSAILQGSVLALAAIGLTLVYGILNLTNFAHGDLLTLGAYLAFLFVSDFGGQGTMSAALALAALAGAGVLLDRYHFRRLTTGERDSLGAAAIVLVAGAIGMVVANPLRRYLVALPFESRTPIFVLAALLVLAYFLLYQAPAGIKRWRPLLPIFAGALIALLFAVLFGRGRVTFSYLALTLVGVACAAAVVYLPRARVRLPYVLAVGGAVAAFLYARTIVLAALLAVAGVVTFVVVLDILLWKRLRMRKASILSLLIISIGVALALRHAIQLIWTPAVRTFGRPILSPTIMGNIRYNQIEVLIIGIGLALIVATALLLKFTRIGKAMRALADNPDLARVSGIDVDRVILYVWMIAGSLAAVAGVLLAYWRQFKPTMGWEIILPTFASIILGGIGSALGALAGAFTIAFAMEMSSVWLDTGYKPAVAFVILLVVLLIRPQGLLGGKVQ